MWPSIIRTQRWISIKMSVNNNCNSCLLWNCGGLTIDKVTALREHLQRHSPLLVVLTETHCSPHYKWPAVANYNVFNVPGLTVDQSVINPRIAGGIALIVRSDCTAVTPLSAAVLPGFNKAPPYNIPTISSQWVGWSIAVNNWPRLLYIIPMYLQARSHKHVLDRHCQPC